MRRTKLREVMLSAVNAAGNLLKKHFNEKQKVKYKQNVEPVTAMDKKAEALIVKIIKKNFPEHDIIAEENKYKKTNSEYCWIIDPIDGTRNYVRNTPFFAASIALAKNNEVVMGAVYNPITNELFFAEKGKGAFLNSKKIHVGDARNIKRAIIVSGHGAYTKKQIEKSIKIIVPLKKAWAKIRNYGSIALELCYVASGKVDGVVAIIGRAWDVSAASLIVEEAGGKYSDLKGRKFDLTIPGYLSSNDDERPGCIAANKFLHKKLFLYLKKFNY